MPNRTAASAGPNAKGPQGITRPAQGPTQQPEPRMQYERDQSSDGQAADEPSQERMGKIAHDDVERGVVDTDKGPAIEEAYEKTRKSSANPERKLRR
jgi:hypothetical protein